MEGIPSNPPNPSGACTLQSPQPQWRVYPPIPPTPVEGVPSAGSLADKAIELELLMMVKEDGDAAVVIFPGDS